MFTSFKAQHKIFVCKVQKDFLSARLNDVLNDNTTFYTRFSFTIDTYPNAPMNFLLRYTSGEILTDERALQFVSHSVIGIQEHSWSFNGRFIP